MSGQLHVPTALFPGTEARYPLTAIEGGLQRQSGHLREEKNLVSGSPVTKLLLARKHIATYIQAASGFHTQDPGVWTVEVFAHVGPRIHCDWPNEINSESTDTVLTFFHEVNTSNNR